MKRFATFVMLMLICSVAPSAMAQVSGYSFTSTSGTYTTISGGTVLGTTANDDEVFNNSATGGFPPVTSTGFPIGFSFVYNGITYDKFAVNTNGWILLGTGSFSIGHSYFPISVTGPAGFVSAISALGRDIEGQTGSELSYLTSGSAGSQVLTVQWKGYRKFLAAGDDYNFQIKLLEGLNKVQFIYGTMTNNATSTGVAVGLRGATNADFRNRTTITNWAATTAGSSNSSSMTLSNTVFPSSGLTYTWIYVPALHGDYTVGVALLNRLTGRNLVGEKRTHRVLKEVSLVDDVELNGEKKTQTPRTTMMEVEEDYGVLMENGKEYQGPSYFPLTAQDKERLGVASGVQGIYLTITAALAALSTTGIDANVRFLLTDATYNAEPSYPIEINPFSGGSLYTTSAQIRSYPGVTSTISANSTSSVFVFNGADHFLLNGVDDLVNLRTITIENTNTNTGINTAAVWIKSLGPSAGSEEGYVRYCKLKAGHNGAGTFGVFVGGTSISTGSEGADNDVFSVLFSQISRAYYGVYAKGSSAAPNDRFVIRENEIGSATPADYIGNTGIYVDNSQHGLDIDGNTIFNIFSSAANPKGIELGPGFLNTDIIWNVIHTIHYTGTSGSGGKGIDINTGSSSSGFYVWDNMISDISGDGANDLATEAMAGIRVLGSTGGVGLVFNSINLSGTTSSSTATNSAAVYCGASTTGLVVKNNILVNGIVNTGNSGSKSYALYSAATASSFTELDYNDHYVSGAQGVLGSMGGTDYSSFSAWKSGTGKDNFSVSKDPGFVSSTDLHVDPANANCWAVNNQGTIATSPNYGDLSSDIDFDTRSTTAGRPTDIGADEFTPTVDPPAATASGPPTFSATTTYSSANRQVAAITWPASLSPLSTLPTDVTVTYYPGVPPPGAGGVNINSYWNITATGGSGYTYTIKLYYTDAEKNGINHLDMVVGKRNLGPPIQPWVNVGGAPSVPASDRYVIVGGLSSFSHFTITSSTSPLPIQLASFTATEIPNHGVLLRWRTLSETNNYGFYVQRRRQNETAWTEIPNSFIAGHGTTNEPHQYQFTDSAVTRGSWSYRLKQVDLDGTVHYTDAIQVSVLTDVKETAPIMFQLLQNYPNPFNPSTQIKFSVDELARTSLEIYNVVGQKLATLFDAVAERGQYYKVRFDGGNLASGVYFYRLVSGKKSELKKLMVLR